MFHTENAVLLSKSQVSPETPVWGHCLSSPQCAVGRALPPVRWLFDFHCACVLREREVQGTSQAAVFALRMHASLVVGGLQGGHGKANLLVGLCRNAPDAPRAPRAVWVWSQPFSPAQLCTDLGSGDGRVCISAAQKFGCRAVGIELDAALVESARATAEAEGVHRRVTFQVHDLNAVTLQHLEDWQVCGGGASPPPPPAPHRVVAPAQCPQQVWGENLATWLQSAHTNPIGGPPPRHETSTHIQNNKQKKPFQ